MFQIPQRQYWSCMGETVLKKSQYDSDVANARANNRVATDEMFKQQLQEQRAATPPLPISLMNQPQVAQPPRLIQTVMQAIMQPLQQVQVTVQNLVQQLQQMLAQRNGPQGSGFMEKAMGQVLSFFFGNKKDAKKDNTEEKEMRDRNEDAMPDIFGDNIFSGAKIEKKDSAGLGAGQG